MVMPLSVLHDVAHGSLRISIDETISDEDVEEIIKSVKEVVEYLRGFSPIWRDLVNGRKEFIL